MNVVNSQESTIINSWWETQTQLHFTINTSVTGQLGWFILDDAYWGLLDQSYNPLIDFTTQENKLVRISNIGRPFSINRANQIADFDGLLFLTTVS
jgi:hypothetical protein